MRTSQKSELAKLVSVITLQVICCLSALSGSAQKIRVGTFHADATPPIGSPVAYAAARSVTEPLSAKGVVILSDEKPVVLCAVDWIGIGNEGQDRWREQLARAARTTVDRVSVHALHQHDGVRCDFTAEKIMAAHGLGGTRFDTVFLSKVIDEAAAAVAIACREAQPVSHIGFGQAKVEKVASNRRILGPDGKVALMRLSASRDSAAIAAPEGLIDPWLKSVSFWNGKKPVAVLSYYTTHPQSYYGKGDVTCEFIGMARDTREKKLGVPHIHFNGASGNIAAGKYNDGSPAVRPVLASRVETAMEEAWRVTQKRPLARKDIDWTSVPVSLPVSKFIVAEELKSTLADPGAAPNAKFVAAVKLAWYQRNAAGHKVNISSLRLGNIWLLNVPGELFVEYQLAAQKLRPDGQVCTAAYEDYGPGYIGTGIAYTQGGYETSERASNTAPEVEEVLMNAIAEVLK